MLPRKENIIIAKSDVYSNRILKLYQYLTDVKHEFVISKQIVRSGTSIGANIAESRNAQGTKDFISKLNIALKEADETAYWLRLLKRTRYLSLELFDSIYPDITEIIAILISSIRTAKGDNPKE
jgi:four helix bundle protein